MTQILPAAPAPASTAPASTGTAADGSSDPAALDEFMAVLAQALGEVVDEAATAGAPPGDEGDPIETELVVSDPDLAGLAEALASVEVPAVDPAPPGEGIEGTATGTEDDLAALAASDAAPTADPAAVDPAVVDTLVDAAATADPAVVDPAVDAAATADPDLEVGPEAVDPADGEVVGEVAVDGVDGATDPDAVPSTDGEDGSGSAEEVVPALDPRAEAMARAEAHAMANLTLPDWIVAQNQAQIDETLRARAAAAAGAATDPAPAAAAGPTPAPPVATEVAGVTPPGTVDPALVDDDPWQQLATVIRPLRQLADGTHRLSLQLRPAELGTVHLEVAVEDGRLSVRAVAQDLATRDVLASALGDLRAELVRSGIDVGSLDVGAHTGDGGSSGEPSAHRAPEPPPSGTTTVSGSTLAAAGVPSVAASSASAPGDLPGRLDLSL